MKKFKTHQKLMVAIIFTSLLVWNCSTEESEPANLVNESESVSDIELEIANDELINQDEDTKGEGLESKTSGGSCGSQVNFKDLVVETSWKSGNKNNRDTYGACGVDGESWMDKYNSGVVMMKCLKGDGHRTELKEDSGDEAALNKFRRMNFTAKYTSIPENGVTIAQIHNRGSSVKRPWIRVYIDDDRYIKIKETETNPTGSSSSYSTFVGPKYTSGQNITINVWTGLSGQKKGSVRVQTGGSTWNKTLWPNSSWSSKSNSYYLKAGVYTEGNDKTPTVKYSAFYLNY